MYLDLTPVKSFLHSPGGPQARGCSPTPPCLDPPADALPADPGPAPAESPVVTSAETPELQVQAVPQRVGWPSLPRPLNRLSAARFLQKQGQPGSPEPEEPSPRISTVRIQAEQQKLSFPPSSPDAVAVAPAGAGAPAKDRLRVTSAGTCAGCAVHVFQTAQRRQPRPFPLLGGHRGSARRRESPRAMQWRRCGAQCLSRPCYAGLAPSSDLLSKPPFPPPEPV